jgi:hypothetical protein
MTRRRTVLIATMLALATSSATVLSTSQSTRKTTPRGAVRLEGRAFADDHGKYLAVGASLMWGVWGYQHDRARLERALTFLAQGGVDYVRVLAVVGGATWDDRQADPTAPGWDAAVAGLTDMTSAHGLRVQWTVFGSLDRTPTPQRRAAVVDRWLAAVRGREQAVQFVEVANEAHGTGWRDLVPELTALARRLRQATSILVATSASPGNGCDASLYEGADASLRTVHPDRSQHGEGLLWRPVGQLWAMRGCKGEPRAWVNNEPIGPGSSVARDDDPLRLTMSAAMTWLAGAAGYVYHARPGVRGGGREDMERYGGPANWWEVANVQATLAGFRAVRTLLPPDLPDWTTQDCSPDSAQRPFDCGQGTRLPLYCASSGPEVVCLSLGIKGALRLTARRPIAGRWYDPLTAAPLGSFTLRPGQTLRVRGRDALVIKGRW